MWYQGDQIEIEERKIRRKQRLRKLLWFAIGNLFFWLGWFLEGMIN